MPIHKPSGAWVVFSPVTYAQINRHNAPSEASCWRKLMAEMNNKGRTQLEEMGYTVQWVNGATCTEYEGS